MGLRCFLYRIYDRAKSTKIVSWVFFRGQKYQHFEKITVQGKVTHVNGQALDGDFTFNIDVQGADIHCEITPCYKISDEFKKGVKIGSVVEVTGLRTYDPPHLGNPEHHEIHPVMDAKLI